MSPLGSKARARSVIATDGTQVLQRIGFSATAPHRWHALCSELPENERTNMGPAIALRLRQHLTLTPQVQQALKLLQMSAMEFAQEMEQALAANPFLEENPDAPAPTPRDGTTVDDVIVPHEPAPGAALERDQEDWGGLNDSSPTLQQHLREQLMISPMGSRDRALAQMVIDSLDDDGYFKLGFDELAALLPQDADVRPEDFAPALRPVQSLDPVGVGARTLEECLLLQLQALPEQTPAREAAIKIVRGNLQLLANREWARLQHAVGCDEAMKPLTLKLIAGELGLHESTVCRVTNNKYMATPRGLFEFKHFFSRRLATENGGAASATAVRAVMKELIAAEDPRAPLSDAELARLLAQQGLRVARRTITKYRALMRLPSVDVRRADLRRTA